MIFLDLRVRQQQTKAVPTPPDAADRVRIRIEEWLHQQGHGSKTKLAGAVAAPYGEKKSRSWVTGLFTKEGKRQDLRLRYLDDVAELIGMPPGELVSRFGTRVRELSEGENRLIESIRKFPAKMQPSFLEHLDFLMRGHLRSLERDTRDSESLTAAARQHEREGVRTTESGIFRRKRAK